MKIILIMILVLTSSIIYADISVDRLDVTLGWFFNSNGDAYTQYIKWSGDAVFTEKTDRLIYSLTIDSDLTKGDAEFDQLRTWWRVMSAKPRDWNPIFIISTEGDHSFERLSTTIAVGMRKQIPNGFIELTLGGNNDFMSRSHWQSDIGLLIDYRRKFGNFGFNLRPNGVFGNGEAHLRGGEMLYIIDATLSYNFNQHLSLNYIINYNNTSGYDISSNFIGIGYHK